MTDPHKILEQLEVVDLLPLGHTATWVHRGGNGSNLDIILSWREDDGQKLLEGSAVEWTNESESRTNVAWFSVTDEGRVLYAGADDSPVPISVATERFRESIRLVGVAPEVTE